MRETYPDRTIAKLGHKFDLMDSHQIVGVFPSEQDDPLDYPFYYSVGATLKHNTPELLLCGSIRPELAMSLINAFVLEIKDRFEEAKSHTRLYEFAGGGMPVIFAPCDDDVWQKRCFQGNLFYEDRDWVCYRPPVWQILFPDEMKRFWWEPNADLNKCTTSDHLMMNPDKFLKDLLECGGL